MARAFWGSGPSWTPSRDCHLVDQQPAGVPDRSQVAVPMWGDSSEPAGGPSPQTADCPRSDVVHVLSSSLRGPGLPGAFCFVDDSQFCFTYPRPTPL